MRAKIVTKCRALLGTGLFSTENMSLMRDQPTQRDNVIQDIAQRAQQAASDMSSSTLFITLLQQQQISTSTTATVNYESIATTHHHAVNTTSNTNNYDGQQQQQQQTHNLSSHSHHIHSLSDDHAEFVSLMKKYRLLDGTPSPPDHTTTDTVEVPETSDYNQQQHHLPDAFNATDDAAATTLTSMYYNNNSNNSSSNEHNGMIDFSGSGVDCVEVNKSSGERKRRSHSDENVHTVKMSRVTTDLHSFDDV